MIQRARVVIQFRAIKQLLPLVPQALEFQILIKEEIEGVIDSRINSQAVVLMVVRMLLLEGPIGKIIIVRVAKRLIALQVEAEEVRK